jgi:hypothetical protein
MSTNYPIIEAQLRLIRALQKGYAEALEAGDWQSADYRAAHLQKLCEGLHHISQLLDKGRSVPEARTLKSKESWINSIRSVNPPPAFSSSPPLIMPENNTNNFMDSSSGLPELKPEQIHDEWRSSFQGPKPKPIDEVW